MELHRIEGIEDRYFEQMWTVYDYSFPYFEKRTLSHQATAFTNPDYHLDGYVEDNILVGFIAYWVFPKYVYVEHFAVNKAYRGFGYGTKFLGDFMKTYDGRTIVLEIDPVVDELSQRRLRFYKSLGFSENPFMHKCPVYRLNTPEADLQVLSHPGPIDCDFYERFNSDLREVVMRRSGELE